MFFLNVLLVKNQDLTSIRCAFQDICLFCCHCLFRCYTYTTGFDFAIPLMVDTTVIPVKSHIFSLLSFLFSWLFIHGFLFFLRIRFDVAMLVPLSAPVLSLQHIIFPICEPSKG